MRPDGRHSADEGRAGDAWAQVQTLAHRLGAAIVRPSSDEQRRRFAFAYCCEVNVRGDPVRCWRTPGDCIETLLERLTEARRARRR